MYYSTSGSTRWNTIADAYFATLPLSLFFGVLVVTVALFIIHTKISIKNKRELALIWTILVISLSFFVNIFVAVTMHNL